MALTITRVLIEGTEPETPNQPVYFRDRNTTAVIAQAMCDAQGRFVIEAPFAILLRGLAGGVSAVTGQLQQTSGASGGVAGGDAEATGTLTQAQPLAGVAAGQAGAIATPVVAAPNSILGSAGGVGDATATMSVAVPLGGTSTGAGGAGPSVASQDGPKLSGSAGGVGGASGTPTQGVALSGTVAGVAGATSTVTVGAPAPATLVPNNPSFTTPVTLTTPGTGRWWYSTSLDGLGNASVTTTGGNAVCVAYTDEFEGVSATAYLNYAWTRDEIDAALLVEADTLLFDTTELQGAITFVALDSGGAQIGSGFRYLSSITAGSGAKTITTSVKAYTQSVLTGGNTWANVATVRMVVGATSFTSAGGGNNTTTLDNFRK